MLKQIAVKNILFSFLNIIYVLYFNENHFLLINKTRAICVID